MSDLIPLLLSVLVLLFYLATLVLLFISIRKVAGSIRITVKWSIISIFTLALIRINSLLMDFEIFFVYYLHESLVLLFSIFVFITSISFFKILKKAEKRMR